jgi:glycosyltransferase involved in cell wall biosynthesis
MTGRGKIRVLQVVGRMDTGGTETWLMHVLRHIDRERFQMDFLVETREPSLFDDEIRALGGNILPCLHPRRPLRYARNLRKVMQDHGPYDVIHSHNYFYSGYVLRLAEWHRVPLRIAHSHNDLSMFQAGASMRRRAYTGLMRRWIDQHATIGLAASGRAASSLFGPRWEDDPRFRVLHCGIDLDPFSAVTDRAAVRAELGIPEDAFVVGHVGMFKEQKNHAFLIRIGAELAAREPNMRLLLVGDGPLRATIEQQVAHAGLSNFVILAGVRSDASRLMLGAMDVMVVPSLHEGLPIVGIEAQAAGLPLVISDVLPPDVDVVLELIDRLPLSQSPACWAEAVLRAGSQRKTIDQRAALMQVEQSQFNIIRSSRALEQVYAAT